MRLFAGHAGIPYSALLWYKPITLILQLQVSWTSLIAPYSPISITTTAPKAIPIQTTKQLCSGQVLTVDAGAWQYYYCCNWWLSHPPGILWRHSPNSIVMTDGAKDIAHRRLLVIYNPYPTNRAAIHSDNSLTKIEWLSSPRSVAVAGMTKRVGEKTIQNLKGIKVAVADLPFWSVHWWKILIWCPFPVFLYLLLSLSIQCCPVRFYPALCLRMQQLIPDWQSCIWLWVKSSCNHSSALSHAEWSSLAVCYGSRGGTLFQALTWNEIWNCRDMRS